MGIKGIVPTMLEVGKIKIGVKGEWITSKSGTEFRPPKKLDHFILTTNVRDEHDDFTPDEEFMDRLKANPQAKMNANGDLVGIPIRLLFDDIDLNFPTQYASFAGSRRVCSGDGERARNREGKELKCPCRKLDPDYDGKDRCKPNGTLSCIVDGNEMFGGCHRFRTTSINTVKSILGSLAAIRYATGGRLAFLPLRLIVQPKTTTTPGGAATTVFIVSVVFPGAVHDLQALALGEARETAQYRIAMRDLEAEARVMAVEEPGEAEDRDVAEEFYPEAVTVTVPAAIVTESVAAEEPPLPDDEAVKAMEEAETGEPVEEEAETAESSENPGLAPNPVPDPLGSVTLDQLRRIVEYKKATEKDMGRPFTTEEWVSKITTWSGTSKASAREFTVSEADAFLRQAEDDIPF
ncbi:MAG: hypothetical protein ABIJ95_13095 [Pseudomonadota bacterium]